jgi:hypothetical protein
MVILNLPITKVEYNYLVAVLMSVTTVFVVSTTEFTTLAFLRPTKTPLTNAATATIRINIIFFIYFPMGLIAHSTL